LSTWPCLVLE